MPPVLRKGLTPAKILQESFAFVDAGGTSALTMRALAQKLDVAPMAIYNHYQDRDAILDALAEQAFARLQQSASGSDRGRHWKTKLRTVLVNAKNLASRHPHIFRLALTRHNKPPSALALTVDAHQWLCDAGLTAVQAFTVYNTFVMLLQGFPFWQESLECHYRQTDGPKMVLPKGWNAENQFENSIDWLIDSVDLFIRRRSKLKPAKRKIAEKM